MTQIRATAASAAALGVFLFLTVALVDVPHDATDAELVTWWGSSANRWSGVWSGLAAIGVAVAVAVLRNGLGRLPGARESAWMAFGRSMATAVMCLWLVTGALRGAVGHSVDVMDQPLPSVDVLRTLTAVSYMLLGLSGMAALGLMVLGLSVAVLRTGALARWLAWFGVGCSGVVLLATVAQYGAYVTLVAIFWSFCLAVVLWRTVEQPDIRGSGAPHAPGPRTSPTSVASGPLKPAR